MAVLNRPRSIYQYSNMAPRLSAQTSVFGVVIFLSKSLLGIESQKKLNKLTILTRKPRNHEYWSIERGLFTSQLLASLFRSVLLLQTRACFQFSMRLTNLHRARVSVSWNTETKVTRLEGFLLDALWTLSLKRGGFIWQEIKFRTFYCIIRWVNIRGNLHPRNWFVNTDYLLI